MSSSKRRVSGLSWLYLLTFSLCLPCAALAFLFKKNEIKEDSQNETSKPCKLPKKRRELSVVRHPARSTPSPSHFLELRPEIRQSIYKFVLGGSFIHVYDVPGQSRLGYWHCSYSKPISHKHVFGETLLNKKPYLNGRLNLLMTCHQVYCEAVESLYRENTFAFFVGPDLKYFQQFTGLVLPQRLADIGSLYLNIHADGFEPRRRVNSSPPLIEDWSTQQWDIITNRMTRLKNITIKLERVYQADLVLSTSEAWVKPMLRLKNLDSFTLILHRKHTVNDAVHNFPTSYTEQLCDLQRILRQTIGAQSITCRTSDGDHVQVWQAGHDAFHGSGPTAVSCSCRIRVQEPTT